MIGVVVYKPLHDLLLVGHDALVQRRVAVVVARVGPAFLVQKAGHGLHVAANHLLVNRVDFLLIKQKNNNMSVTRFKTKVRLV